MSSTDERYTPPEVFGPLNALFQFSLDPCTTSKNHLGTASFFSEGGLEEEWWGGNRVFVNPPYSEILAWAEKAVAEIKRNQWLFVAFLIPNDCSTSAFKLLRQHAWGRWEIPFRVKFDTPEGKKVDVARSHVVFFLGGLPR